jgi:cystathionine gamma-synthase
MLSDFADFVECSMIVQRFAKYTNFALRFHLARHSTMNSEWAGRCAEELAKKLPRASPTMKTKIAHCGLLDEPNAAMSPRLEMATTYTRPAEGPYNEGDSIYTREDNPTRLLLEREVAKLETIGKDYGPDNEPICCAFSSGMMAASSIVLAHSAPMTVLLPEDLYHGIPSVLEEVFKRFHVNVRRMNMANREDLETALLAMDESSDAILWLESPSNPLCQVLDIGAICKLVKQTKPSTTVVVDSTLAPPPITQPLTLGADVVMHSATKYFGGHSDVLLGVVTTSPWSERGCFLRDRLRTVQTSMGGVASPMDSWLTLRGLRTLMVRVQQQSLTALKLAKYLESHPKVKKVNYPGLESQPSNYHDVAKKQMKDGLFGGVLSIEMGSESEAMALAGAIRTIHRATSLGGTETLMEHRASIEPPGRVTSPAGLL